MIDDGAFSTVIVLMFDPVLLVIGVKLCVRLLTAPVRPRWRFRC